MNRFWFAGLMWLFASAPAWGAPLIQNIRHDPSSGQVLITANEPVTPHIMRLQDPWRIVIDVPGTLADRSSRSFEVDKRGLQQIRFSQFTDDTVRLVLELDAGAELDTQFREQGDLHILQLRVIPLAAAGESEPRAEAPRPKLKFEPQRDRENEFVMRLEGTVPFQTYPFRLDEPDRLVIDIPELDTDWTQQPMAGHLVKSLRMAPKPEGGARLVFDLNQPVSYRITGNPTRRDVILTTGARSVEVASRPTLTPARNGRLIVLDAGHGGNDPGAIGKGGVREKDVNLSVTLLLKQELEKMGMQVILARHDDREILLQPRVDVANQAGADLFISIHSNSIPKPDVRGIETYYRNPSGLPLAKAVHGEMIRHLGATDRGVRYANFFVIHHTTMPAILCEIGFLTHQEEEQLLAGLDYQRQVAVAIARGVQRYWETNSP